MGILDFWRRKSVGRVGSGGVGFGGAVGLGSGAALGAGAAAGSPRGALFDSVVNSLNNLCNSEATFSLSACEPCGEALIPFCRLLREKRFAVTSALLRFGYCFLVPFFDCFGKLSFFIASPDYVRNLKFRDGALCDISLVCDSFPLKNGGRAVLLRRHSLCENGDLTVAYYATAEGVCGSDGGLRGRGRGRGRGVGGGGSVGCGGLDGSGSGVAGGGVGFGVWDGIAGASFTVTRAFSLGVGIFNSPKCNPDVALPLGVPLNFGCEAAENRIIRDLELIQSEFENGKSLIFADPRILLNFDSSFKIADNIFPVSSPAGRNAPNIDVFNPTLRHEAYAAKLQQDFLLYEKQLGVSAGLLSRSDASSAATATAVKRANCDTCALLAGLRDALDLGNLSTLRALGLFLRVPDSAWRYSSDWFDPFEDPSEQWARLVAAREAGAVPASALTRWLFPNLSDAEVAAMCGEGE